MAGKIFDGSDYEENRVVGALGYLFFFVPLFAAPKSAFAKFCANQGLLLCLGQIALWLVQIPFSFVWFLRGPVNVLTGIAHALLGFIGIYYMILALQNDVREIPFAGHYKLIK